MTWMVDINLFDLMIGFIDELIAWSVVYHNAQMINKIVNE